jgi:hypothetical protein
MLYRFPLKECWVSDPEAVDHAHLKPLPGPWRVQQIAVKTMIIARKQYGSRRSILFLLDEQHPICHD